jgi:hypothetical protein
MKTGIAIFAENQEVVEVEISSLEDMQAVVGGLIATAIEWEKDTLYVDDEGLFNNPTAFTFWDDPNYGPRIFAGNGLVIGTDYQSGESTSTSFTVDQVKDMVRFVSRQQAMLLAREHDL